MKRNFIFSFRSAERCRPWSRRRRHSGHRRRVCPAQAGPAPAPEEALRGGLLRFQEHLGALARRRQVRAVGAALVGAAVVVVALFLRSPARRGRCSQCFFIHTFPLQQRQKSDSYRTSIHPAATAAKETYIYPEAASAGASGIIFASVFAKTEQPDRYFFQRKKVILLRRRESNCSWYNKSKHTKAA